MFYREFLVIFSLLGCSGSAENPSGEFPYQEHPSPEKDAELVGESNIPAPIFSNPTSNPLPAPSLGDPSISYTGQCWKGQAPSFCATNWEENSWQYGVTCPRDLNPLNEYCMQVAFRDGAMICCRDLSPPERPKNYP